MRTIALFVATLLVAACAAKSDQDRADPFGLLPMPETIEASQAGEHVGRLVVVQTQIDAARVERGQAVLEPAGRGSQGLTIAIAPPLVGPSASQLAEKYGGQEISAIGYISDFGGRLELLIGDPNRVRLVEATPAEPGPVPGDTQTAVEVVAVVDEAPAEVRAQPARSPAASATGAKAVAVPVVVAGSPPPPAADSLSSGPEAAAADRACAAARRAWQEAVSEAREPLEQLLGCFDRGEPRCTAPATRARIALAEVAASEERLRWVCGGNG